MEAYNKKGLDNMKVLTGKVLCVVSYSEEEEEIWTAGKTYRADQHKSGSWSIETNQGDIGLVPGNYLMDKFEDNFIDVSDRIILSDITRYCLEMDSFKPGFDNGTLYFDLAITPWIIQNFSYRIEPDEKSYEEFLKPYIKTDPETERLIIADGDLKDALDDMGPSRISMMIAKAIDREGAPMFDSEIEMVYETLKETCSNITILKDYLDKELAEITKAVETERE